MSNVLPVVSALGTTWLVEIFDPVSKQTLDETFGLVQRLLLDFEATYSRFNPDSQISLLNQNGTLLHPDPTTVEILRLGQQLYTDTDGIFNLLVGEHLIARGYDASYSFKPTTEPAHPPSPLTALTITDSLITLATGKIDLGGYGKGYLLDKLSRYLQEELRFKYFLINGGGDMYATSDLGKPITIYLEHPTKPGTYIAETTLQDQGFAASSTHKRRWKVSGKEYSHIVDTANQKEATADESGIYVKVKEAVTADAWATTLLISNAKNHTQAMGKACVDYALFSTTENTLTRTKNF